MAIITVTTLDDTALAPDGEVSLREALLAANTDTSVDGSTAGSGADTIEFDASLAVTGVLFLDQGQLEITSDVTIDGDTNGDDKADVTINAGGASRVFLVSGGTSTIESLVMTGGNAASGGGVRIDTGALTLVNSTVADNQATGNGGGLDVQAGTATLINSTLSGNSAGSYGGGLHAGDFAGDVTIINTTLSGNSALNGGGGINTISDSGMLSLINSTVSGNEVTGTGGYGGGIYSGGATTLTNSIVAGNAATNGAEIYSLGPGPTYSGGNVIGVGALTLTDIFAAVDPVTGGGLLQDNGGLVETVALAAAVTNPAIDAGDDTLAGVPGTDARGPGFDRVDIAGVANNGANISDLGAFEVQGIPEIPSFVVTTADDVVDQFDNLTSLREALAYADSLAGADTITFDDSLDTVQLDGAALVIASDVTIDGDVAGDFDITIDALDNSRVFDVTAGTSTLQHLIVTGGHAVGEDGGGVRVAAGASLTLADVAVVDNDADGGGGGIWNDGTLTLTDTVVAHNYAVDGGGIATYAGSTATLINTTLTGNHADGLGGGILGYAGAALTLVNSTLSGNSAYAAGGIGSIGSDVTLINSTLSGNYAGGFGGGIATTGGTLTLTNSIVAGNASITAPELSVGSPPTLIGGNIIGDEFSHNGVTQQSGIALTDIFAAIDPVTGGGLLADNGGPVETVALRPVNANPALDGGDDNLDPAGDADARGFARAEVPGAAHNGTNISDLGAFELQGPFEAASLIVTTADDVVDITDGLTSLREALAYAASNPGADTITFDGSFFTVLLDGSDLVIASNVTIDGDTDGDGAADITIDALDNSRVFDVTAGISTLQHLIVAGGYAAGEDGGGVRILGGATLTLADVVVFDSYADGDGGGIHNAGTLTLTNSVVGFNTGDVSGGIHNAGTMTLTNSAVVQNEAAHGGGISTEAGSNATLTNVVLSGNFTEPGGDGGGINNVGSMTLVNSTLSGNSAAFGGGVFNIGDLTVSNSTLSGNDAGNGGGIVSSGVGSSLTLTNSIVAGNEATTGADLNGSPHSLVGGNIVGDTLSLDGVAQPGALALDDIFAQVGINPYTFVLSGLLADNSGPLPTIGIKLGGAAQDTGSDTDLPADAQDLNHNLNTGEPLPLDARGFARIADAHVDLGALELQPGQSFEVTTLEDELDSSDPNATLLNFGGLGDLSLREALVLAQQDKASYDTITFAASLIGGPTLGVDDGTLTLAMGELAIEGNVTIDGDVNHDGVADITIDADHSSAALHVYSGVVGLNGLTITKGDALYGAGISVGSYIYGGYADVTVSNSTISNNSAEYGGGISVDVGSALRLINSTVSGNLADVGGGIAVNEDAILTVVNTTISDNHVAGFYGYGGGIAVYGGASATLINSTISGNTGIYGGGIYNAGELTLINTTLANNVADYGGGLYMNDCGCGEADVISSTITGNYAGIGGGIYHAAGTLNLTNSIVAGNGSSGASYGPDLLALDTVNYSGVNVFSDIGIGDGEDIHEANLANIFATVATFDPTPVDGDEFDAGVLANNGGPVKTVAIKIGGVAFNAGDNGELPADAEDLDGDANKGEVLPFDARGSGFTRLVGGTVDIGAFEIQNTPPAVHFNTGLTLDEGASATITMAALDFDDAEQDDADIVYTVTTATTVGALRLNATALGVGGTFTQDDINSGRVSYAHDDSETIADAFGFSVSDGDGGSVTGQSFAFTITPVDDTPPVQVANTGLAVNEGASATIIDLQLDYNDAQEPPASVTYTITTAVAIGTLLLNGVARGLGSTFTQDDIDNSRLTYTHDGSETTATSFGFSVTDGVNPAVIGQSFAITINAVNDLPVNNAPGAQSLEANHSLAITGLSVADPDAFAGAMNVALSVDHGTLALAALGGAGVSGSGTSAVQITGTLAAINATLAGGNVIYTPVTDYFDNDTLTMVTNDGGNTGIGGALTDTDTVAINLHTHLFGTPDDDEFILDILPAGDISIDALGGFGDTITFNFRLVDATVRYVGNTIIIDGPSRHTVLTGFEKYEFTDGTVDNNDGNPLVDDLFYYSTYHDVWNAHADADAHFATFGWHENRDPSFFFSTSTYLSANPDVAASGDNPLTHFHNSGWQEGRVPSIHFDPQHYLAANPDVAAAHVDPLEHYLLFGHQEGRTPFAPSELIASNGFDYVWYLDHNADVAAANVDPFAHFMTVGWTEGRNPNALFDVNGYLATYADVDAANVNPLTHYDQFGRHEGRDPSVGFDTTSYLAAYADVAAAHVNPLTHFLQFGIHEGRSPFADGVWG